MALSLNKLKRLGDAGLTDLFEADRKLWTAMAKDAHAYTSKFVRGSGNAVRPDDVVPTLTPALEVSDRLRTYLAERKLTQNYWYTWFAELIVDRLWSDLKLRSVAKTPDADLQAREFIDRVVESHRKNGYGLKLSKKRYEQAVARVAASFRGLIDASKGRAA